MDSLINNTFMRILLYEWRHKRKLSLRKLAMITGLGKSTLNNIENGITSPTADQLEIIAIALECKISDLIDSPYL